MDCMVFHERQLQEFADRETDIDSSLRSSLLSA